MFISVMYISLCVPIFAVDVPLWEDTDGAVQWVRQVLRDQGIRPPDAQLTPGKHRNLSSLTYIHTHVKLTIVFSVSVSRDESNSGAKGDENHAMFLDMFQTAIEMIEEEGDGDEGGGKADAMVTKHRQGRESPHITKKQSCPRIDGGGGRHRRNVGSGSGLINLKQKI